ncbi:hypothetical protein OTB20_32245 [Streptomyces sp. H27-H1]|uniref:hypothetical protein n=1 Tax=Streptomyces sp. H27-H1 TaxID=2996461 RepID=UPI00226E48C1|nr:hypothetical protein [Streptomyces sp. H27-H1]MCY0930780.1 hypothetical protein [Streptomyces sp. H27-H1]
MAFPQTPIELLAEMQIGGIWTDITADLYARAPLTIERGRPDEAARVDPARVSFQLNNRDNEYSPRNPSSPNYGLIGRNTPVRFSLPATEAYMSIPAVAASASTPDVAALDIVGDIDVQADMRPDVWASELGANGMEVMGKYQTTGNQRSWGLLIRPSGSIQFRWSADGTALLLSESTVPVPFRARQRGAVRATLDVNNGGGGWTATFYTAPTLAGPWVQLGDPVIGAGVTSIFSSTAPLEVGDISTLNLSQAGRRYYAAQVRSSIGGTVVANPVFTAQSPGATTWADSAGRTWTLSSQAAISQREYRAHAEVSAWPPRWDESGRDLYVPAEAAGIMRRLGQGAKPLASTLRRRIPRVGNPVAYWPMEEGRSATQAYSPVTGVAPLVTGGLDYAADDTLLGSDPLPQLSAAASMAGVVPAHTATGSWLVSMVFYWPTAPASDAVLLDFTTSGSAARIRLTAQPGGVFFEGLTSTGATLFSSGIIAGADFYGVWNRLELNAVTSGGNVDYRVGWANVSGAGFGSTSTVAATAGTVTGIATTFGALAKGVSLGHLGVFASSNTDVYDGADDGYLGERASARIARLCTEEGVPAAAARADTTLGPQRPDTLLALLGKAEAADLGVLLEDRETLGLRYRARTEYYNQPVTLTLNYATAGHVAPPLEPIDDDQRLRNDRTVVRDGGSSARAVDTTSPLSTQAPPAGVGMYDDSRTLSLAYDTQPADIAGWLLHMGTWDEARYPSVHINLAAAPSLIPAVLALDIGDRIQIINPPTWLPPGPIDLIVEGYTETIGHPNSWDIVLNCSPAGAWTVAASEEARADTAGCTLGSDITSTATSAWSLVSTGTRWVTSTGRLTANPDMEVSVGNWTGIGGTISQVATPSAAPFGGSWSLQLIPSGVSSVAYAESDAVAVSVGTTYRAHAWLRCATSRSVQLRIGWRDSGGVLLSVSTTQIDVNAGEWTQFSGTAVAPASTVTATVLALMASTPPTSDVLLADVMMLATPTSLATEFPILLGMAGEHVLLRTCSGASSPQTGSGLRSQNGIVKAQTAGTPIGLAHPTIVAL